MDEPPEKRAPSACLTNAWAEVEAFVRLGPKPAFSVECAKAAEHIEGRLTALGLEPAIDVFTDATPVGPRIFRNVTAELPGATGLVVLVAHYDTKSGVSTNFAGANDSGSGVGLLLELARCLRAAPSLPIGVLFAFVDGEECLRSYGPNDGLHGSQRLVARLEPRRSLIRGAIVLDMVGDRDLTVTIPRNANPQLLDLVFRAAHRLNVRHKFRLADHTMTDDHVPFLNAGYPAVDLIDFEYGAVAGGNEFWHTDQDTLDKLSPQSLATVGEVTLDILYALPASEVPKAAARRPTIPIAPRRPTAPRNAKPAR
jgi:glutaminyl-peptide cyclotransferase